MPGPGEPLFLEEDTDAALALAQEEQDTCPACGFPKTLCRDPANQVAFEPHEQTCWPSWRLALFHESDGWKNKHDATKQATQVSARFREGHEPPADYGLEDVSPEIDAS